MTRVIKWRKSTMTNEPEKWVNIEDIAEYLSVSKDTVRSWIKKGTIPHTLAEKAVKFRKTEVDEWLKQGKLPTTAYNNDEKEIE